MNEKREHKAETKVVLRPNGLLEDFIKVLPDRKKNSILNQILLDSLLQNKVFHSLVVSIGQKEAGKMQNKIKKLLSGLLLAEDGHNIKTISAQIVAKEKEQDDFLGQEEKIESMNTVLDKKNTLEIDENNIDSDNELDGLSFNFEE